MLDPIEFGKAMGAIVREATAPLQARIEQIEKALSERPAIEEIAEQATDGMEAMIREHVARAVAEIPAPKDGDSVTAEDVRPLVAELVDAAIKTLPPAPAGKDADMAALQAELERLVKAIPPPPALSADEVAALFERRFSDLTLSWERQARDTFERAAERMPIPKDGKDGRDALPLESFDLALDEDGRTVTVKMQAGDTVVEKSVKIPAVIDRGVYSKEAPYDKGDGVTYGGCFWIAQKDAPEGVPGASKDFRLAVKKGRDGKDLRDNSSARKAGDPVKIREDESQ